MQARVEIERLIFGKGRDVIGDDTLAGIRLIAQDGRDPSPAGRTGDITNQRR